ncbi:MAG: AAA family ATPase [Saprospiraceae bacterium]|nr:AAA family ATPase [Saprospiraceae bacterium]
MTDCKDRYLRLRKAVELERAAEEIYFRNLAASKSIKERIDSGIVWYPVDISRQHYTIGEYVELELVPSTPSAYSKSNAFRVGATAILFINKKERIELRGSISYLSKRKVRLVLATDVLVKDYLLEGGSLGIELIFDDRPYRVMLEALDKMIRSEEIQVSEFREALCHQKLAQNRVIDAPAITKDRGLNPSQVQAIDIAHAVRRIAIIHGPPGTGKTTTLVGLIQHLSGYEKQILVAAPSNNAVDLLAKLLHEKGLRVLRLGNVTRMGDSIAELSLDEQVRNHQEWQHIKQVKIEAEQTQKEAAKFKRKFGEEERRNRGLMFKEAKGLRQWASDLEDRLIDKIVSQTQVICATLVGCAAEPVKNLKFKTLVIDEGSQALEPECWIAMHLAERVIVAGDHKQLPPTVKSKDAADLGLTETILDRMTEHLDESALLTTQYRMHPNIMGFSNATFYEGKLQSAMSVTERQLPEIGSDPIQFIDTSGCGFQEEYNPENRSRANRQEYLIIREHIISVMDQLQGFSIGIISPYREQVRVITQEIEEDPIMQSLDLDINSIDGFQGQEKDVIYLSLVRSNDDGELGFLKDFRRLNVALTRARLKLVIVGDLATLGADETYLSLADYVEKNGKYQSAWEYMTY